LAPRAARSTKSYAEVPPPDKNGKRRRRGGEVQERLQKRSGKVSEAHVQTLLPRIEGAAGYVCEWAGGGLSKKDANNFVKAVRILAVKLMVLVHLLYMMNSEQFTTLIVVFSNWLLSLSLTDALFYRLYSLFFKLLAFLAFF
jgi:hypothetical protein